MRMTSCTDDTWIETEMKWWRCESREEIETLSDMEQVNKCALPVVQALAVAVFALAVVEGVRVHAQEPHKGVELPYAVLQRGA
jgi:hypothetical protein